MNRDIMVPAPPPSHGVFLEAADCRDATLVRQALAAAEYAAPEAAYGASLQQIVGDGNWVATWSAAGFLQIMAIAEAMFPCFSQENWARESARHEIQHWHQCNVLGVPHCLGIAFLRESRGPFAITFAITFIATHEDLTPEQHVAINTAPRHLSYGDMHGVLGPHELAGRWYGGRDET